MRLAVRVAGLTVGAVLSACGGHTGRAATPATTATASAASPTASPSLAPGCRSDVHAGVRDPWRLAVMRSCVTVTGTVRAVFTTGDGDLHVDIAPDERFASIVNAENRKQNHGWLVTETVPRDQPGVHRPRRGDHVAVTGVLVVDLAHGWVEIHPAWRIAAASRLPG